VRLSDEGLHQSSEFNRNSAATCCSQKYTANGESPKTSAAYGCVSRLVTDKAKKIALCSNSNNSLKRTGKGCSDVPVVLLLLLNFGGTGPRLSPTGHNRSSFYSNISRILEYFSGKMRPIWKR